MSHFSNLQEGNRTQGTLFLFITLSIAVSAVYWFSSTLVFAGVVFHDINPNLSIRYRDGGDAHGASGGRVNGLASVAGTNQVFYAASEWGGLYKTQDGGVTWLHLGGFVPQATWDVEVDPVQSNRVYGTSFFDGKVQPLSGIQVSQDGGNSWVKPVTSVPIPGVNTDPGFSCGTARIEEPSAYGIAIRPDAPNQVFVGTNCGLAISLDAGATWSFVDPTPGVSNCADLSDACDVWDVIVQPGGLAGAGIIDICGDDGHWRSVDGGSSWAGGAPELPRGRCSIAASPDESYVLFVADDRDPGDPDHHYIWESDDGGVSWDRIGKPYPPDQHKRIPFLTTNQRSDEGGVDRFDLWYGEQDLWRASCETYWPLQQGGPHRCPDAALWSQIGTPLTENAGAHGDAGDLVFDRTQTVDACPVIFSSDGGVYYRDTSVTGDCHDPEFKQPQRSPHGLWLWGMAGVNQPGGTVGLYFGTQDDGMWGTTNAQAAVPFILWTDDPFPADASFFPSDSFSVAAEEDRVVWNSFALFLQDPGLSGGGVINTPDPPIGFRFVPSHDLFGEKSYVMVAVNGRVYRTDDVTLSPVNWSPVDPSTLPPSVCGVRAAVVASPPNDPVFYVQAGDFWTSSNCGFAANDTLGDQLWRSPRLDETSGWERVDDNGMTGGIGIFGVDSNNAARLYASNLAPTGPRMVFSNDAGATWHADPDLDSMLDGSGQFRNPTRLGPMNDTGFGALQDEIGSFFAPYPQASLVAFDPEDPDVILAGGRDSGLFLSTDGGRNWGLITDPFQPSASGIPHLPRPHFAHFDHDGSGTIWIYVGTQGRGVWRIRVRPPVADANGPYTTLEGQQVSLDASGSSDPDGQPMTFEWDLNDDGEFDDAVGMSPSFDQVGQDGNYPVRVRVSAGGVSSTSDSEVTVVNVAPALHLDPVVGQPEGTPVSVSGLAVDPGWLDPLSGTIAWNDGSPPEPLLGVLENLPPDATLTFSAAHTYGDNGGFSATVCVSDDKATTCQAAPIEISNVAPSAEIDESGAVLINGIPTILASAGEELNFSGRSVDPGSDDLTLSWDWDDGPPAPDVVTTYLVNPPNPDPFPSPSLQPRDVTDSQVHAFAQACAYSVSFTAEDDDGGQASDSAQVIIVGDAFGVRSAGYWAHQYQGRGRTDFDSETLYCYLSIVGYMSTVFDEVRSASSIEEAADILWPSHIEGSLLEIFDRQLLAAWLNFANGAIGLHDLVDTDGNHVADTDFASAIATAESVRVDPTSTRAEIEAQKNVLEYINTVND